MDLLQDAHRVNHRSVGSILASATRIEGRCQEIDVKVVIPSSFARGCGSTVAGLPCAIGFDWRFNPALIPLPNSFAPSITLPSLTCRNAYTGSRDSCITPHPSRQSGVIWVLETEPNVADWRPTGAKRDEGFNP